MCTDVNGNSNHLAAKNIQIEAKIWNAWNDSSGQSGFDGSIIDYKIYKQLIINGCLSKFRLGRLHWNRKKTVWLACLLKGSMSDRKPWKRWIKGIKIIFLLEIWRDWSNMHNIIIVTYRQTFVYYTCSWSNAKYELSVK